jgi:arginase family enzyme
MTRMGIRKCGVRVADRLPKGFRARKLHALAAEGASQIRNACVNRTGEETSLNDTRWPAPPWAWLRTRIAVIMGGDHLLAAGTVTIAIMIAAR